MAKNPIGVGGVNKLIAKGVDACMDGLRRYANNDDKVENPEFEDGFTLKLRGKYASDSAGDIGLAVNVIGDIGGDVLVEHEWNRDGDGTLEVDFYCKVRAEGLDDSVEPS